MAYALTWMPGVLLEAGLQVAEVPGWQGRGRAPMGTVLGVMIHHTAGPAEGNMPSLRTLIEGRKGDKPLPGPLSQLGLGRDGTWYVVAAGRANHAGEGQWNGVTSGNSNFIGIECENVGTGRDGREWPEAQMTSLLYGVAALLRHTQRSADWCCGHREYAPQRKIDPLWDLQSFRTRIGPLLLSPQIPRVEQIPAMESSGPSGPVGRPTLRRGSASTWVSEVQRSLGIQVDHLFGPATEAAVREFQRTAGLVPDGIVGPRTWARLSPP